jgi:hypothetical protein
VDFEPHRLAPLRNEGQELSKDRTHCYFYVL